MELNEDSVILKSMSFGRVGRWKWPVKDDILSYPIGDVIKKLMDPIVTGRKTLEFTFEDF